MFQRILLILFFTFFTNLPSARAQTPAWALGVLAGEPTGVTVKFWLTDRRAIDVNVAYSWFNRLRVSGDYLFHWRLDRDFHWRLTLGLGPEFSLVNGAFVANGPGSAVGFGMRIPVGVEWQPAHFPIAFYVELSPGVGILPTWSFQPEGYVGARVVFDSGE